MFLGWPKPQAGKRNLGEGLPGFFRLEALTETLWAGTVPIMTQLPCCETVLTWASSKGI